MQKQDRIAQRTKNAVKNARAKETAEINGGEKTTDKFKTSSSHSTSNARGARETKIPSAGIRRLNKQGPSETKMRADGKSLKKPQLPNTTTNRSSKPSKNQEHDVVMSENESADELIDDDDELAFCAAENPNDKETNFLTSAKDDDTQQARVLNPNATDSTSTGHNYGPNDSISHESQVAAIMGKLLEVGLGLSESSSGDENAAANMMYNNCETSETTNNTNIHNQIDDSDLFLSRAAAAIDQLRKQKREKAVSGSVESLRKNEDTNNPKDSSVYSDKSNTGTANPSVLSAASQRRARLKQDATSNKRFYFKKRM